MLPESLPLAAFAPGAAAEPPRHRLNGTLTIAEAPMELTPAPASVTVLGRRVDRLPGVRLQLASTAEELIPVERTPIAPADGTSYWQLMPGVGRVWRTPADDGRSRGALPFALLNPLENETHHGLLTFTFDETDVRDLRFQVVQRTAPYLVECAFVAEGRADASFVAEDGARQREAVRQRGAELRGRLPRRPWSDLRRWCDAALLDVDGGFGATAVTHALVVDGVVYAQPCRTAFGDHPYPAELAFGVWSVTKTAFATVSALRLTRALGSDVGSTRVREVLDVATDHEGWRDVTIGDCLDMATGIGDAGPVPEPPDTMADYGHDPSTGAASAEHYRAWVIAPSRAEKLDAAFACATYPWGPGRHARYRDQDIFVAGAAMQAVLQRHRDPDTRLWDTMLAEVYRPIGIAHLFLTHTCERDGRRSIPVSAYGLVADLDALAKIALLLQRGGRVQGADVLDRSGVGRVLGRTGPRPRPKGQRTAEGEYGYRDATWYAPFRARSGASQLVPCMVGYGGNYVVLLPNDIVGIRIAHDPPRSDDAHWDPTALMRIADRIRPM